MAAAAPGIEIPHSTTLLVFQAFGSGCSSFWFGVLLVYVFILMTAITVFYIFVK